MSYPHARFGTTGRYLPRSARAPLARTRPAATASCHAVRPIAISNQVTGSISTTFGGVPRVCFGPSTHCIAPNGGTRTSTDRPGALSASTANVLRTAPPTTRRSGTPPERATSKAVNITAGSRSGAATAGQYDLFRDGGNPGRLSLIPMTGHSLLRCNHTGRVPRRGRTEPGSPPGGAPTWHSGRDRRVVT